jgi:hypothetical protein
VFSGIQTDCVAKDSSIGGPTKDVQARGMGCQGGHDNGAQQETIALRFVVKAIKREKRSESGSQRSILVAGDVGVIAFGTDFGFCPVCGSTALEIPLQEAKSPAIGKGPKAGGVASKRVGDGLVGGLCGCLDAQQLAVGEL